MPVLPREELIFPNCLLTASRDDSCRWWALYTKPRQEKALARDMLAREIPFFLPLAPRNLCVRGQRMTSYVPMFPSYLFICASDEERTNCLTTNRVVQTIRVLDQGKLQDDLRQIHQLIENGSPLMLEPRLSPGRRVRVRSGKLMGMIGTVLEAKSRFRLMVSVDFLRQGVSLEIDEAMVEVLD